VNGFDSDKSGLLSDLDASHETLLDVVRRLSADDLTRARRGSWSVSRILGHVLQSERLYIQLISVFSGEPAAPAPAGAVEDTPAELANALESSRAALLRAVTRVGEADFYRLQIIGHEEYSVLSILENVANHEREHAEQIMKTLASA
jgi:uncharacterized damage-inducible protein DinB